MDAPPLAGKSAIVSGASSGVGKALALRLVAAGCGVVALGRRSAAPPEYTGLAAVRYMAIDLGAPDVAATLRSAIPEALAAVDILVNCAGHDHGGGKLFGSHAVESWQDTLRVNLHATMGLTSACLPAMVARDRGDIVLIGSITSRRAARGLAAYAASKHAVHGFAEALRVDYRDTGLRVIEIIPGVIRTGFAGGRFGGDDARAAEFYRNFTECLDADDVARAALYALGQPAHVSVTEMVVMPTRERG